MHWIATIVISRLTTSQFLFLDLSPSNSDPSTPNITHPRHHPCPCIQVPCHPHPYTYPPTHTHDTHNHRPHPSHTTLDAHNHHCHQPQPSRSYRHGHHRHSPRRCWPCSYQLYHCPGPSNWPLRPHPSHHLIRFLHHSRLGPLDLSDLRDILVCEHMHVCSWDLT